MNVLKKDLKDRNRVNMDRTREETNKVLEEIFEESPAYLIDWLRENDMRIVYYISNLNKNITKLLKDI